VIRFDALSIRCLRQRKYGHADAAYTLTNGWMKPCA
jgi:hypothetical protein